MDNAGREEIARRNRPEIYEETGYVTKTALRCDIARFALHRWIKRSEEGCGRNCLTSLFVLRR